jgi:uncharacterized protein
MSENEGERPQELKSETSEKYGKLKEILRRMEKVLVAYSGGVDSSLLLKTAQDVLGGGVLAVIASSDIYPEEEQKEAVRLAEQWGVRFKIVPTDELTNPDFISNSPLRCYFCKKELFSRLKKIAETEGILNICDGANQEDLEDFRPGTKAAEELGVSSPLQEAGLGKKEIREISRWLGLPNWNKPSLACLSSRFPYGTKIDRKGLKQISRAENFLRRLGFSQVRVRHHGPIARIEVEPEEMKRLLDPVLRRTVAERLKSFGFFYVTADIEGYRMGSLNETLDLSEIEPGRK